MAKQIKTNRKKFDNILSYTNTELEDMIYKRSKDQLKASKKFNLLMADKEIEIFNKKKEPLKFVEGEEWRQCFAPDEFGRMFLCPEWFIGNKTGRLITTHFKDRLHWIYPETDKYGKIFYHFAHPFRNGNTTNTVYAYVLQSIVFPDQVEWLGDSWERYEKYGLAAFFNGELTIDVHHIEARISSPELAYDVANFQVMPSVDCHRALEYAPQNLGDETGDIKHVKRIRKALDALGNHYNLAEIGSYKRSSGRKIVGGKKRYSHVDLSNMDEMLNDPNVIEFCIACRYGEVLREKHPEIKKFEFPVGRSVYRYIRTEEDPGLFIRWMTSEPLYVEETVKKTADYMDALTVEMSVDTSIID